MIIEEPFMGCDRVSSKVMASALKKEAHMGSTIVTSVSQGATDGSLKMFDRLIVLNSKGIAYSGKPDGVANFLSLNNIDTLDTSPMDALLDNANDMSIQQYQKHDQIIGDAKLEVQHGLPFHKTFCLLLFRNLHMYAG